MQVKITAADIISWLFGIAVLAAGILNMFWGNDAIFGIFIALLSLVYYPPFASYIKQKTGIPIPAIAKIVLGLLIIWMVMGIGEFFDKFDMMKHDL